MITAQYTAACVADCGHQIEPGQPIEFQDSPPRGWRHVVCPDSPDEAANTQALTHPQCQRCFTHHPGEC